MPTQQDPSKRLVNATPLTAIKANALMDLYDINTPEGLNRILFHVELFYLASCGGGAKTWKPIDFQWEKMNGGEKTGWLIYEPLRDKNHQGGDQPVPETLILDPASKMDKRFLELFTLMMAHRPACLDPQMQLILSTNKDWSKTGNWFKKSPVGKNMFGKWFQEATKKIGLDHSQPGKQFTPHSHRATTSTLVMDAGASKAETCWFTNHQDAWSLQVYVNPNDAQKAELKDAAFAQSSQHPVPSSKPVSTVHQDEEFSMRGFHISGTFHNCTFQVAKESPEPSAKRRKCEESSSDEKKWALDFQ